MMLLDKKKRLKKCDESFVTGKKKNRVMKVVSESSVLPLT